MKEHHTEMFNKPNCSIPEMFFRGLNGHYHVHSHLRTCHDMLTIFWHFSQIWTRLHHDSRSLSPLSRTNNNIRSWHNSEFTQTLYSLYSDLSGLSWVKTWSFLCSASVYRPVCTEEDTAASPHTDILHCGTVGLADPQTPQDKLWGPLENVSPSQPLPERLNRLNV